MSSSPITLSITESAAAPENVNPPPSENDSVSHTCTYKIDTSRLLRVPNIKTDTRSTCHYGYGFGQRSALQKKIWKLIQSGNIIPEGPLEPTPALLNISLKQHQQRMLYEMLVKEHLPYRVSSQVNCFCIGDKVGAGKSIEVLALICRQPLVQEPTPNKLIYNSGEFSYGDESCIQGLHLIPTLEFKSNLIVVPHGIYNQWKQYIDENTKLKFVGIANRRDVESIDFNALTQNDAPHILLIKSTRYNDFAKRLYSEFPHTCTYKGNDLYDEMETNDSVHQLMAVKARLAKMSRPRCLDKTFVNELLDLQSQLTKIQLDETNSNIENQSYYSFRSIQVYKGPLFQRVFFDEANSIKLPRCQMIMAKFHWFVSSSMDELMFPSGTYGRGIRYTGFLKKTLEANTFSSVKNYNFVQDMYLKNTDAFVENSFRLPDPIIETIECFTPQELRALQNITNPEVMQALNAGDIESAVSLVGCRVVSQQSISGMVLHKLKESLHQICTTIERKTQRLTRLRIELDIFKDNKREEERYLQETGAEDSEALQQFQESIASHKNVIRNTEASLVKFQEKRAQYQMKIDSLSERISNLTSKTCPICTDNVTNACLTPCCKNAFCFQCIATSLRFSQRCPLCRTRIEQKNLTVVAETAVTPASEVEEERLPKKMEALLHIITSKEQGRFLVFSEYENTFNTIMQKLEENNISFSKLNGSTGRVTNIIHKFETGVIKVLLLNAKYYGSGLNLQSCTDIVLYHRMSSDLEKQIIGRGQRPGRTEPLKVTYLTYDTEVAPGAFGR